MPRDAEHDTVEQYRRLAVHALMRDALAGGWDRGTIRWRHSFTGQELAAATFFLDDVADPATLRLLYETGAGAVLDPIALEASRPNYGGRRWWARCPRCSRKVAHLYQNPLGGRFRCRTCWRLTYTSCQESGSLAGMLNRAFRLAGRRSG